MTEQMVPVPAPAEFPSPTPPPPNGTQPARMLTKQQILDAPDLPTEVVKVPEWGGSVMVRGLSGRGRDEHFASMAIIRDGQPVGVDAENQAAKLAARCIIDPDTAEPMFSQHEVHALGEKSSAALDRVVDVAYRLSGLSEDSVVALGKGSVQIQSGGSASS